MGAGRVAAGLLTMLIAGCALVAPADPFERACWDVRRGELLDALVRLERLDPSHPRAAQARTLVADVRGRMARALELMRQGLQLRGEGQFRSAADLFRLAQAEWPGSAAARSLVALDTDPWGGILTRPSRPLAGPAAASRLAALSREPLPPILGPVTPISTETRKQALARLGREPVPALPSRAAVPPPRLVARAPLPVVALPAAPGDVVPQVEPLAARPVVAAPAPPRSPQDRPVPPVVVIAPQLQRELDAARAAGRLDQAAELLARIPDRGCADPAWRHAWALLFHRRALVRYGRGDLAGAAADWEQALALTPEDARLRTRLQTVRAELRR